MGGEALTLDIIQERMRTPWAMTPRERVEAYQFLSSECGRETIDFFTLQANVIRREAAYVTEGSTSAQARTLAHSSDEGTQMLKLKGKIKAYQEMINALKRAQAYDIEEARGNL